MPLPRSARSDRGQLRSAAVRTLELWKLDRTVPREREVHVKVSSWEDAAVLGELAGESMVLKVAK